MKRRAVFLIYVLMVLFIFTGASVSAQKRPTTVAELALYKGADRQQILEEGAKKEGKLIFYTSGTWAQNTVNAFQKKYPYIKVEAWRAGGEALMPRVLEEYKAGKYFVSVLEFTQAVEIVMKEGGILQPFYSPNLAYIEEGAVIKVPGEGVFAAAFRASGIGLGYNTKLVAKDHVPKTYQDLLNPKWKGKMAIAGSETGADFVKVVLDTHGEDFIKELAKQEFDVHMVSARTLSAMVINGEYALSPTIFDSHVMESKKKAAPIDWVPLEPVYVHLGHVVLPKYSPHPHAAMLFIDFDLSKEAAEIYKAGGYTSLRKDVSAPVNYKKYYGAKSLGEVEACQELFNKLFLKNR